MTRLWSYQSALQLLFWLVGFTFPGFASGQILNQDQQVEVHNLPSLMARSHDPSEVLLTSLDTILHDHDVCCGKDSALGDSAQSADPTSLKDVARKLDGRHLLSDGRPIMVKAEYLAPDAIGAGSLAAAIINQHAALVEWDSHLYVVHGVVYMWMSNSTPDAPAPPGAVIHKLLLWDTRYSDSRRTLVINRDTEDLSKLQGVLLLDYKLQ